MVPHMPDFSLVRMETARLALRPLRDGDESAMFAIFSDPQVMRYWSSVPWTDIAQARQKIEADQAELPAGVHLRLALTLREGDATAPSDYVIGNCSLFKLDASNRRGEIGYVIRPDYGGKGLMHEALVALVDYAFETLDLNRLEADIDPRNIPSAKSLTRLGFAQEGLLRERWIVNGEVSDSALYGLLQGDWRASKERAL
jgi:RimJ/RimL family protein N-acetyltransferase